MKKQKICIIGGGLTGLISAVTLSKLDVSVDLVTDNFNQHKKSNRTIAISQDNYEFLRRLDIFKFSKKDFWPCTKMELYTSTKNKKFTKIFQLDREKKEKKNILYMMKSSKVISSLIKYIQKNKLVSIKSEKIRKIYSEGFLKSIKFNNKKNSKYNLIILCTGSNSMLVKNYFNDQALGNSYNETSITTILKHNFFHNNSVRQIFFNDEILALLPISNTQTSIVLSTKKNIANKYKTSNLLFKKKIKFYTKYFIKKISFNVDIEFKDLNFLLRKKFYRDRVLLFGDALHEVHPLAGQGFNMILRDLENLQKILSNQINLGLDIGSLNILSDFSKKIRPRNFAYSLGIDFIKHSFSIKAKALQNLRNKIISNLNKNNFANNLFFNLADKGLKF